MNMEHEKIHGVSLDMILNGRSFNFDQKEGIYGR